ncbi:hypothetical protein [Candidatus Protochlamydia phocaeensis]|uniref:hypothetical protein n=1 Tax=Candidatus Protochlamydia phocaeensis TaxID=1414722 RepID=UPI000837DA26|nr:hypothetical protein [Candidatus Protochlamydia phocaeensis]
MVDRLSDQGPIENYSFSPGQSSLPAQAKKAGDGRKYLVVNSESKQIGWTRKSKMASSAKDVRQFVLDHQESLSSEELRIIAEHSKSKVHQMKNANILSRLFQKISNSIERFTKHFFIPQEKEEAIHNQIIEKASTGALQKDVRAQFEQTFLKALNTASVQTKFASIKYLKSALLELQHSSQNLDQAITETEQHIAKREEELKATPDASKQNALNYLKSELETLKLRQEELNQATKETAKDIGQRQKDLQKTLNPIREQFMEERETDGEFTKKNKAYIREKYSEIANFKSLVFNEEMDIHVVKAEELKGESLKGKTILTDRVMDNKRSLFRRDPSESSVRKEVAAQLGEDILPEIIEEGPEAGQIKHTYNKYTATLEDLNKLDRPKIRDLEYAGFNELEQLFRDNKVSIGFKGKHIQFITAELTHFLSNANIDPDGSNIPQLKEEFIQIIRDKAIYRESFTKEEFADISKDLNESGSNLSKLKAAITDGTWKEGEEREFIEDNIPLSSLDGALACIGQLFDKPQFSEFLQKIA